MVHQNERLPHPLADGPKDNLTTRDSRLGNVADANRGLAHEAKNEDREGCSVEHRTSQESLAPAAGRSVHRRSVFATRSQGVADVSRDVRYSPPMETR